MKLKIEFETEIAENDYQRLVTVSGGEEVLKRAVVATSRQAVARLVALLLATTTT